VFLETPVKYLYHNAPQRRQKGRRTYLTSLTYPAIAKGQLFSFTYM